MKYDRFFKLAKEAGIEEAELYIGQSYSLSFSLFHGEIDNYTNSNSFNILARGLINGKFGAASCDVWSKDKAEFLVKEIVNNAKVIENDDPNFIFPGSEKYKKVNTFNKELTVISIEEKLQKLHELEGEIKKADDRITEVAAVEYSESAETVTLINSKGLNLTQKSNYFVMVGQAIGKQGEQVKSGYDLFLENDFRKLNVKELAKTIAKNVTDQLGGEACESNKYKAVLSSDVVASLMRAYLGSADAEDVQKHSSLFVGKLNQPVASKKVTIEDKPLEKNVFSRWFDDEGVATYNKHIIKNGVLQTYLYNLTTAAKDNVQTTGNGYRAGSKMSTNSTFMALKPGKKSLDELFAQINNGVYITDVSGLHAGLNPQSGNFSLQSTGFLIKDGKKDRPLDIITVSGNLMELFMDIQEVGSDVKIFPSGTSCSSVIIKGIAVSGK